MSITRRKVLAGSAVGAASLASGLAAPAIAANEPIKIGYLPALTGPSLVDRRRHQPRRPARQSTRSTPRAASTAASSS